MTSKLIEVIVAVRPQTRIPLNFPIDMLRYDGLHPYREEDSGKIYRAINEAEPWEGTDEVRTVLLAGTKNPGWNPKKERWLSFGWSVVDVYGSGRVL